MSLHDVCLFSLGAAFGASAGAMLREMRGVLGDVVDRGRARRRAAKVAACPHRDVRSVADVTPDADLSADEWMRDFVYGKCAACDAVQIAELADARDARVGTGPRGWIPSDVALASYRPSEWHGANGVVYVIDWTRGDRNERGGRRRAEGESRIDERA